MEARMKSLLKVYTLIFSVLMAPSVVAQDSGIELSTAIHAAIDITQYANTNVDGGIGFDLGLRQHVFFHPYLGIFAGLDYVGRNVVLNISEKSKWLDIPFGLAFRYSGSAMGGTKNYIDLGLYYATNQTKTSADPGITDFAGGLGFYFAGTTLFPITPSFEMGFYVTGKYSFFSPFAQSTLASMLSTAFGVEGRFKY